MRTGCPCVSAVAANGHWAPRRRWRFRGSRICSGSLDFVMDTLSRGRRFRVLTLVDDFTRECPVLVVDTSLTALRIVRELGQMIESRCCPRMIISDNGTEFTSNAILAWQESSGSSGTTSHRASRCRTALSKASMAGYATSASMST